MINSNGTNILQTSNIIHILWAINCWSLRCSWGIACRRFSKYIFILDLKPGFNGLGKGNNKTRRDTSKFWNLVSLILEVWSYIDYTCLFPSGKISSTCGIMILLSMEIVLSYFLKYSERKGLILTYDYSHDWYIAPVWNTQQCTINSLWPSDAKWRHKSGSRVAQILAWCRQARLKIQDSNIVYSIIYK